MTLLPVVAAFATGCLIFGAAEVDLLDGPLRTLLAPIAVLLPGALIVTGMSELAAGAMVAGSARLIFGTVQLLLFTFGVLAAARVIGPDAAELANLRIDELGPWAAWVGLLLIGAGVYLNVSAPPGALPWMLALLALTFLAQSGGQEAYGAPVGGFLGGLVAALGAALVQRFHGPPSLVVFLPAFWLLVPGSLGLLGTTQLVTDAGDGFATAQGAVGVVVAIALGVLIGSALGRALEAHGRSPPGVRLRLADAWVLSRSCSRSSQRRWAPAPQRSTPSCRPRPFVPGSRSPASSTCEGGDVEQEINRITVALETVVEVETDDSEFNSTQRFATQPITGGMTVRPKRAPAVPVHAAGAVRDAADPHRGPSAPGRADGRAHRARDRALGRQGRPGPGADRLAAGPDAADGGARAARLPLQERRRREGQAARRDAPVLPGDRVLTPARSTAASSTSSRSPSSAARRRPA